MNRVWILQTNPKLYDIDQALNKRPVIYWRVPQYTDQVTEGDRALIWRAGQHEGFVGWGVFRADPAHYEVSSQPDPLWKGPDQEPDEFYAPVGVWPAAYVPKAEVAALLPEHRIVTAPMGTVFPLDSDELAALGPVLDAHGYDLARSPEDVFTPLPIVPDDAPESKPSQMSSLRAPRSHRHSFSFPRPPSVRSRSRSKEIPCDCSWSSAMRSSPWTKSGMRSAFTF